MLEPDLAWEPKPRGRVYLHSRTPARSLTCSPCSTTGVRSLAGRQAEGWVAMSTRRRKPYEMRSGFVTSFERDVVGATVDVSVTQLRAIAAKQLPAAAGSQLGQLSDNWTPDLCSGLTGLADGLVEITNVPKHAVAWVFTALAHAMGCPPFLAQILGRLIANWLLTPVNPIDVAVRRIRILGVLLCAQSGDLGSCPCLVDLAWQLGTSELKKELDQGLGIAPDSFAEMTPLSAGKAAPDAAERRHPHDWGPLGTAAPLPGGTDRPGHGRTEPPPPRPSGAPAQRGGEREAAPERRAAHEAAAEAPRSPAAGGATPREPKPRPGNPSPPNEPSDPWGSVGPDGPGPDRPGSGPHDSPDGAGPDEPRSGPHEPPEEPSGPDGSPGPFEPDPPGGPQRPRPTEPPGGNVGDLSARSSKLPVPAEPGLAAIKHACVVARGDSTPPVSLRFGVVV